MMTTPTRPWPLRVFRALLMAPWALGWFILKAIGLARHLGHALKAGGMDSVACPAGHTNDLFGRWVCECGAEYLGHAFAPCPICHLPSGWIRCDRCGLATRSPFV